VATKVYEQDSVFYQAMQMGILETVGLSWQVGEDYVEQLRAITAEQIRQVAREFLVDDALTVAVLVPQPMDKAVGHKMSGGNNGSH
jgi:zinc protease